MQELYQKLKEFGKVKINESLVKHTTFKIGGPADLFVKVGETNKLIELLNFLRAEGVEFLVLGGGSNLLVNDEGWQGVVVKIETKKISAQENVIEAEAGVLLGQVVSLAAKNNLSGLEWAVGIPGTVGGAVRGNAGAMGKECSNNIDRVEVWQDGEIKILSVQDCQFAYRQSLFKFNNAVVLRVWYKLTPGNKTEIMAMMQECLKHRTGRFPTLPSAGSFFKNVDIANWPGDTAVLPPLFVERKKVPVGWLVDQVGMRGFSVGGAKVSEEHGNFVVNAGGATQAEILKVIETVREKVYNKFKVDLEPEVEII